MPNEMENNRIVCRMEKESREKRLLAYSEAVQKNTLELSAQIIKELVEEEKKGI